MYLQYDKQEHLFSHLPKTEFEYWSSGVNFSSQERFKRRNIKDMRSKDTNLEWRLQDKQVGDLLRDVSYRRQKRLRKQLTRQSAYFAGTELAISALERYRQEGPWGSLASQPNLINEPQVPVRDPVSQEEEEKTENRQQGRDHALDKAKLPFVKGWRANIYSSSIFKYPREK